MDSLLNGEGYYQEQLANAFQNVADKKENAPEDDWFSSFDELDLFVTGTDVLGKVSRRLDNTGKVIEVKDNHAVFILKHRQGRTNAQPFTPNAREALANLCRITSCFPVAFPVVTVKLEPEKEFNYTDAQIDTHLLKWGKLNNQELPKEKPADGYQLYFVDGGVLDNRLISPCDA